MTGPLLLANARALRAKAQRVETGIDGQPWVQNPFPYQAKCLAWLREEFAALSATDQDAVTRILERAGCSAVVHEAL